MTVSDIVFFILLAGLLAYLAWTLIAPERRQ